MVRAIVGANWGDEGKGKITDMFASQADMVIRFQGGANAGHTIINDYGKFALHLLPSGVCQPGTVNIIGNGVALDIEKLVKEIEHVTSAGVPQPNILVSERAQIMMPYHVMLDTYEEERLKDKKFGSTKSGIAPFYSDKYAKIGFQVCELFEREARKSLRSEESAARACLSQADSRCGRAVRPHDEASRDGQTLCRGHRQDHPPGCQGRQEHSS